MRFNKSVNRGAERRGSYSALIRTRPPTRSTEPSTMWLTFNCRAISESGRSVFLSGINTIRIGVTNTRANELTDEKLPSDLLGPVRLLKSE